MKHLALTFLFLMIAGTGAAAHAQVMPGRIPDPLRDPEPKHIRDTLEKMRIEEEKKEYAEMLKRGEEAVKLATDLEEQIAANGRLTDSEMSKLSEVEKLVKKIRSDLGARDGDEPEEEEEAPATAKDAVATLRQAAVSLYDELKSKSRFTVSATAIYTTNAMLRVAKFLRVVN